MIAIRRDRAPDDLALFFPWWLLCSGWCLYFERKSSQQQFVGDRIRALHIKTRGAFTELLLMSIKRLYHCSTTQTWPAFHPAAFPGLHVELSSLPCPHGTWTVIPEATTGDGCSTSNFLLRRTSYGLWVENFAAVRHLNAERVFRLKGGLWNVQESFISAAGDAGLPALSPLSTKCGGAMRSTGNSSFKDTLFSPF